VYNGTQTNVSCRASNNAVNISLYRNSTLVNSSIGSVISDIQTLALGTYSYTCNTTGNANYTNASTANTLNVTPKNPTRCLLSFSPASGQTYPVSVNASCYCNNSETSYTLYRNGTNVTSENNIFVNLSAGTYAYICNSSETQNYTAGSNSSSYLINKANPSGNLRLALNGNENNISIVYGTQSNATGWSTLSGGQDLTYNLYRNGQFAASGNPASNIGVLAAGNYTYTYNTTGGANYTSGSSASRLLIINKSVPFLNLSISPSWNELYSTPTTVNCIANTSQVTPQLYVNGTNVSIPYTTTHSAGTYNYTCNVSVSQNYTAAATSNLLTISKAATQVTLLLNGVQNNITFTYPQTVNAVFSTTALIATMYRNGTNVSGENNTPIVLAAGYYNYTVINTGDSNYNSSSKTYFVTVQKNTSSCFLAFAPSSPQTYGTAVNAACSCTNPETGAKLYRNGTDVTLAENGINTVLPGGVWNYTCNASATQNYTSATNSSLFTINKAASEVNLLLNGTDGNITIDVGASVNHSALMVTPSAGHVELYKTGVLIASGNAPLSNVSAYASAGIYNITAIFNATQNHTASFETHHVSVGDFENPVIVSHTIEPYDPTVGYNVSLNASATDNGAISGIFANITLPNGTVITLPLLANYTVPLSGRYNVTFWANDTAGNIGTFTDYFVAGDAPSNITFNVVDKDFFGIPVNITVYFAGTNKQVNMYNFTGTKNDSHTNILYDLFYMALDGNVNVRLNGVNLSLDNNGTLGLDRLANLTGFAVTYGVYSDYHITDAILVISYANTTYTNENYLGIYKCATWNFTTRTCPGGWALVSSTQDKLADEFTIPTSGFSAFAIKQEPYCGDGTCNGAEDCLDCTEDCGFCRVLGGCLENWTCTEWSECADGVQTRTCTDKFKCGTKMKRPALTQNCTAAAGCDEQWTCGPWTECWGGAQLRACTDLNGCGTQNEKPTESQSCEIAGPSGMGPWFTLFGGIGGENACAASLVFSLMWAIFFAAVYLVLSYVFPKHKRLLLRTCTILATIAIISSILRSCGGANVCAASLTSSLIWAVLFAAAYIVLSFISPRRKRLLLRECTILATIAIILSIFSSCGAIPSILIILVAVLFLMLADKGKRKLRD